jgi:serine/threonine-protein kinase
LRGNGLKAEGARCPQIPFPVQNSGINKLKLTLLGDEKARLVKHLAINPMAYEEYLKGRDSWGQWSEEGMTNSLSHFRRAIEMEPDYAPAHAGMALTYISASTFVQLWPPREGVLKGKKIAQKAIELDPALAEGYYARGLARLNYDWDWDGAESDFKKALELTPNSALALDNYASFLLVRGRHEEAVVVQKRALEQDPLSPWLYLDLGWIYFESYQFDQAIPQFHKALELDRNFHMSRNLLGWAYQLSGKSAEAAAEFQTLARLAPDVPYIQASLGCFYASTGRSEEAKKVLADLEKLAHKRYVSQGARALVYLGLGQKSVALDWLEKGFQDHDNQMWSLSFDPLYAPLRNEPRFQSLVKKVENGGR